MLSISIVDGLFNRLIFREIRRHPYSSKEKQMIYAQWEWGLIGVLYLLVLPILIPTVTAFFIGGLKYAELYLIISIPFPWDNIFGKLVFDDWFGDTPSIAFPGIEWIQTPIHKSLYLRYLLGLLMTFILINS